MQVDDNLMCDLCQSMIVYQINHVFLYLIV